MSRFLLAIMFWNLIFTGSLYSNPTNPPQPEQDNVVIVDLRGISTDKYKEVIDKAIEVLGPYMPGKEYSKKQDDQWKRVQEESDQKAGNDTEYKKLLEEANTLEKETNMELNKVKEPNPIERGEFETQSAFEMRKAQRQGEYEHKLNEYQAAQAKILANKNKIVSLKAAAAKRREELRGTFFLRDFKRQTFKVILDVDIDRYDMDNGMFVVYNKKPFFKKGTMKTVKLEGVDRNLTVLLFGEKMDSKLVPEIEGVEFSFSQEGKPANIEKVNISGFNDISQAKKFKELFNSGKFTVDFKMESPPRISVSRSPGYEGWIRDDMFTPVATPGKPVITCYKIDFPKDKALEFNSSAADFSFSNLKIKYSSD